MIEKDISSLSRNELIEKYRNMKTFIIKTQLAENVSEELIKSRGRKEINTKPLTFVVDLDMNILLKANESIVYRDKHNRILMVTTEKFEILD